MRPFLFVLAAGLVAAACKHDDGMPTGTATIHSGTPEGVRVTDVPEVIETAAPELGPAAVRNELGDQLARAYCSHDRACGLGDAETLLLAEETCFNDARWGYRTSVDQWPCRPVLARVGFDSCIAAIREASCSARRGEGAQLRACQAAEICRRSDLADQ